MDLGRIQISNRLHSFPQIIRPKIPFFFRLLPRDTEIENFIGRPQLTEFLCWLDYTNCVAKECADTAIAIKLAEQLRFHLFESSIEPAIIEPNFTAFALVLASKVINKIDAKFICDREYICSYK